MSDTARTDTDKYNMLIEAIIAFHSAKGRYNTQIACARLFELAGLPAVYPEGYKPKKEKI